MIYTLIGRTVVKACLIILKRDTKIRRTLAVSAGAAVGVTVLAVAGFLVARDTPEG